MIDGYSFLIFDILKLKIEIPRHIYQSFFHYFHYEIQTPQYCRKIWQRGSQNSAQVTCPTSSVPYPLQNPAGPSLLQILLTICVKMSFFLVVSTSAYLVMRTYMGLRRVVAMAVEKTVLSIIHTYEDPAQYLTISKLWNWIEVQSILQVRQIFEDLQSLQKPYFCWISLIPWRRDRYWYYGRSIWRI